MPGSRISLEPSVLKVADNKDNDTLVGSRCSQCGRYFFPQRVRCGACTEPTTEPVDLSKEGTLISYTLITSRARFAEVQPPYILGEVMMPEGIRIYTLINSRDVNQLKIGQRTKLDTLEIKKDEDGNSVIAYSFSPVAGGMNVRG